MSARPGLVHGDPTQIGPYRILGRLGVGRMGVVFAATDSQDQPVAVKVIRKEIADDPSFRARLVREVAAVSRVQGPFLLPLLPTPRRPNLGWPPPTHRAQLWSSTSAHPGRCTAPISTGSRRVSPAHCRSRTPSTSFIVTSSQRT